MSKIEKILSMIKNAQYEGLTNGWMVKDEGEVRADYGQLVRIIEL
jgi:hypothetical protein